MLFHHWASMTSILLHRLEEFDQAESLYDCRRSLDDSTLIAMNTICAGISGTTYPCALPQPMPTVASISLVSVRHGSLAQVQTR